MLHCKWGARACLGASKPFLRAFQVERARGPPAASLSADPLRAQCRPRPEDLGLLGEGRRGWSHVALAAAATSLAEQVPSSLGVSCARGAAVPKFLLLRPLPPFSATRAPPQFPFREGGERVLQWPQGTGGPVATGVLLYPLSCSSGSIRVERSDGSSRAESASPAGGARAPSSQERRAARFTQVHRSYPAGSPG